MSSAAPTWKEDRTRHLDCPAPNLRRNSMSKSSQQFRMSAAFSEVADDAQAETGSLTITKRACQHCRQRKIRCTAVPHSPGLDVQKCMRCSKLALDCVFLPPTVKRRRNRNEPRIKELERKLREIEGAISEAQTSRCDANSPFAEPSCINDEDGSQHAIFSEQPSSTTYTTHFESSTLINSLDLPPNDPVSRGLVSDDVAHELYWTFCSGLAPIYPLVLLPTSLSWTDARTERPALFRAILSAGASSSDPKLFKTLFQDTGKFLAEEVVMKGRKSLDLIQALLVLSTWYHPPEKFQELKFSQYANMAATMVLDLRSSNEEQYQVPLSNTFFFPSAQLSETCRTFLACYFLCSSMAHSFRRPTVLPHGSWVDDCISVLENVPTAHPLDCRLVEWTRLQRIAEETLAAVGLQHGSTIDFSDVRTRFVLKCGVEQTMRWLQALRQEVLTGPMIIHYHMILISLHEPVLYDGHDVADFRPPYTLRPLPLAKSLRNEASIEAANALTQCIASAQQIIHTFVGLPTESLRSVPVIIYTRITYAAVVLIKFDVSARLPQSIACLLHNNELNPMSLLLKLIDKLGPVVGLEHFCVPATFLGIISRMAKWYGQQFDQFALPDQNDIIEPMTNLGMKDTKGATGLNDSSSNVSHVTVETQASGNPYGYALESSGPEAVGGYDPWESMPSYTGSSDSILDLTY